jgi:MoxR-like ATPase
LVGLVILVVCVNLASPGESTPSATAVLSTGPSWVKQKVSQALAGYLCLIFLTEVWCAQGKSLIDKLSAVFLRNNFNNMYDTGFLSEGMGKRFALLRWVGSETTSPELKMLIKENMKLLSELSFRSRDRQKQQVFLANIKLRLFCFAQNYCWPIGFKMLLLEQLQKLANGKPILGERATCLLTKGYEACSKIVINKLSLLLGREPLVLDCNLLREHDFRSFAVEDKVLYQPSIFTKLYLQRKPGINFILIKNVEALGGELKLKAMQRFLLERKSLFDPCVGDCLDFSQDFVVLTTNDRSYAEVNMSAHQRLFSFEKDQSAAFVEFLRQEYLQEQQVIEERHLYPDECAKLLSFYVEHYRNKSFERFCASFFSLLNFYDGDFQQVLTNLLSKKQAKYDVGNVALLSVKKLLKLNLSGLITDDDCLAVATRDQQELGCLHANNHPGVAETAAHLRKVVQIAQLKKSLIGQQPEPNLQAVKNKLDTSHFGLEKLKEEILNFVAMLIANADGVKGKVLLLVGPPGSGKTTIAKALAAALHKPFAKVSCGGIIQQGQLKGWPRSYQQAQEGLLVQALLRSESLHSVLLLDEVDKMLLGGKEELSSPLLEILDPEQNKCVLDHYLECFFDYSAIFFVLTANETKGLPPAFLDRCQIISLPAYSSEEKLRIAQDFLLPKILGELRSDVTKDFTFPIAILPQLVAADIESAGVRKLQERIEAVVGAALREYFLTGTWSVPN